MYVISKRINYNKKINYTKQTILFSQFNKKGFSENFKFDKLFNDFINSDSVNIIIINELDINEINKYNDIFFISEHSVKTGFETSFYTTKEILIEKHFIYCKKIIRDEKITKILKTN